MSNEKTPGNEAVSSDADLVDQAMWLTMTASLVEDGEYVQISTATFAQHASAIVKLFVELQDSRKRAKQENEAATEPTRILPVFIRGGFYESQNHGLVEFMGLDMYFGQQTYHFRSTGHGELYWSENNLAKNIPALRRTVGKAIDDVIAEREAQIGREGFSYTHDDQHNNSEMAIAAACYANPDRPMSTMYKCPLYWPWDSKDWKPKDRRRDLVRAAALIIAEIERLDRLTARLGDSRP